jgi:hypothetical protein
MMYRQGDVLLIQVGSLPPTTTSRGHDERGRLVLVRGEATGHAHAIDSSLAELFEDRNDALYLRVDAAAGESVQLVHEEHAAITLPPGNYRVVRQVEYRPEARRPRYVLD